MHEVSSEQVYTRQNIAKPLIVGGWCTASQESVFQRDMDPRNWFNILDFGNQLGPGRN